jgi:hypothetical protein
MIHLSHVLATTMQNVPFFEASFSAAVSGKISHSEIAKYPSLVFAI